MPTISNSGRFPIASTTSCDHLGLYGSFVVLESPRTTPVVHLENLRTYLFLDRREDVQAYTDPKPSLLAAAVSAEDSMELILRCAEEMEGRPK